MAYLRRKTLGNHSIVYEGNGLAFLVTLGYRNGSYSNGGYVNEIL